MQYDFDAQRLEYIKEVYPEKLNPGLAKELGVKQSWLEAFATKHGLKKNQRLQYPDIPKGHRVGDLEVLAKTNKKAKNNILYECRCKCGKEFLVRSHLLRKEKIRACSTCSALKRLGVGHHRRGGLGPIGGSFWAKVKSHAHERGIEFCLTIEEALALYEKQERKCALSGLPISFSVRFKEISSSTASLDRIDPSLPYTKKNVQWVHKEVNFMKNKLSQSRFVELCQLISQHTKSQWE